MDQARHPFLHDMPVIRWVMVLCACLGLWGQLLVESRSLPGELPRGTIMRLTGIDIAPVAMQADRHAAPPHHHMVMANAPHQHGDAAPHGHDHAEGCPLCPLLHLPALALVVLPFLPLPPMAWAATGMNPASPARPLPLRWGCPRPAGHLPSPEPTRCRRPLRACAFFVFPFRT